MVKLTSAQWWLNMFVQTFITICFIYLLKVITAKINVPVVSDIVQSA